MSPILQKLKWHWFLTLGPLTPSPEFIRCCQSPCKLPLPAAPLKALKVLSEKVRRSHSVTIKTVALSSNVSFLLCRPGDTPLLWVSVSPFQKWGGVRHNRMYLLRLFCRLNEIIDIKLSAHRRRSVNVALTTSRGGGAWRS